MTAVMNRFFVYIMTNQSRVVLYTGVTNSLQRRMYFHARGKPNAFTRRYNVNRLVYYECFERVRDAISREKEIKGWRREKKVALIRSMNPRWDDLGRDIRID